MLLHPERYRSARAKRLKPGHQRQAKVPLQTSHDRRSPLSTRRDGAASRPAYTNNNNGQRPEPLLLSLSLSLSAPKPDSSTSYLADSAIYIFFSGGKKAEGGLWGVCLSIYMYVRVCVCVRERERERETDIKRHRDRQCYRDSDTATTTTNRKLQPTPKHHA